jgi:DNA invertase Pin-like site-specific DNA recombinase
MGKIMARHLERQAYVYVRQSSPAQVLHHQESTQRQYRLRERALRLGWPQGQVGIIDEDQGQSGAEAGNRSDFQRLVSEVALGRVGAIVGLEVSRLARSCADWYRLLEVAALAGSLIIDEEGVYDPNQYNDRLLLGLKGTLSEAELHLLKQRMLGARRNKARRGELRIPLPVGYVWDEQEGIRLDPDERVRDTVALFFETFARLGSAQAVVRYFENHRQPFPRRGDFGNLTTAVTWHRLGGSRAVWLLRNPIYAGVYAYSRRHPDAEDAEDVCAGGRIWRPNAHPGYITLPQYEANVARLVANRSYLHGMSGKGSAREGKSLLQGIVLCGVCGRRMSVSYGRDGEPSYECRRQDRTRRCQWIRGVGVDELLERVVLETLSREELQLALKAFEKIEQRSQELRRQWAQRLESARYEAQKAARRYHEVEPENRLVARTLEREWNESLQEVDRLEAEYRRVRESPPLTITDQQRQQILALATDVERLWRAPTTQAGQRKQLVRLLIEDVTLRAVDEPWQVEVSIRWRTGAVSRHEARRTLLRPQTPPPEVVDRIEALYADHTDRQVADILNAEGYRSGFGRGFTEGGVAHIRKRRNLRKDRRTDAGRNR